MVFRKLMVVLTAMGLVLMMACGPKPVKPQSEMDTPEHHVEMGNKLLNAGQVDGAIKEFDRAKALNPEYSPAYLGLGLANAHKADYDTAFDMIKKAKKYAENNDQKYNVAVGTMQIYLMGREKIDSDWLQEINNQYALATDYFKKRPDAYYYMGMGYKYAYKFRPAVAEFSKVLDLNNGFVEEADREYKLVQKIERAMPGTAIGKKIALLDKITRADLAALLIQELNVDDLYHRKAKRTFDTTFKAPGESAAAAKPAAPLASDIQNHVLRADIETVIKLGIKGLQPYADGTFHPDQTTTRAEFAMIVEDILITITGDKSLATQFIGDSSPFPDLRNDLPYFDAVMVCTTRGIMSAEDMGTGEFRPAANISGADALLAIRALKTQLAKY